jgi:hypothetical protein
MKYSDILLIASSPLRINQAALVKVSGSYKA